MKKNYAHKLKKYLSGTTVAIAASSGANAAIIYTDIPDVTGTAGDAYFLDLNGDATPEFRIHANSSSSANLYLQPIVSGAEVLAAGSASSFGYPYVLTAGTNISSVGNWLNNSYSTGFMSLNYASGSFGYWVNVTDGYVGLRFLIGADIHYGWARMDVGSSGNSWTVKDYAYENCAFTPIEAGETSISQCVAPCTNTSSSQTVTACDAAVINGNTYTTSQTVIDTLVGANAAGCDSIVTTNLTINNTQTRTQSVTACNSATIYGSTYTSSQTVVDTLVGVAAGGCDSIVTTNLTINQPTSGSETRTVCGSYTWPANSTTYSTSGTYTATLTNADGCDSTATLNLTIDTFAQANITVSGCGSVTVFGSTYTSNQTVNDTIIGGSANGCDSITVANVIVNSATSATVTDSGCDSYTWGQNGMTYTATGMYMDTINNAAGCDSVVTLDLTINNSTSGSESATACDTYTWSANSTTYTTSGAYTTVLTNAAGCDSTATLNLTINNSTSGSESVIACNTYTWSANSTTYTTSGTYSATLTNADGCDSTATLNLTISNIAVGNVTLTGCDSVVAFGTTYTSDQTVNDTIAGGSAQGCDTVTIASIVVNPSYAMTMDTTISNGDSILFNGNYENTSGTYTANLTTAESCDSIITLNLTVGGGGNPQGLAEFSNGVNVYPNPTKGALMFEAAASLKQIRIIDMKGSTLINEQVNLKNGQIDMRNLEAGIYFYELIDENGKVMRGKVIKE